MNAASRPTLYHIPVCPFSQRLEILLSLKDRRSAVDFRIVDNAALLPGRRRSWFAFEPEWRARPWPPGDKYGHSATDAELGLR